MNNHFLKIYIYPSPSEVRNNGHIIIGELQCPNTREGPKVRKSLLDIDTAIPPIETRTQLK